MTATQQTDSVVAAEPEAPALVAEEAMSDGEAFLVELTRGLAQVRRGRFDVRLARREGLASDVVEQFNELVALQERHSRDLLRISRVVGREGRMSERLDEESYDGAWAADVQSVNALIDDLAAPTADIQNRHAGGNLCQFKSSTQPPRKLFAFGCGEFIVTFARRQKVFFGVKRGGEGLFFLFRFQYHCLLNGNF